MRVLFFFETTLQIREKPISHYCFKIYYINHFITLVQNITSLNKYIKPIYTILKYPKKGLRSWLETFSIS